MRVFRWCRTRFGHAAVHLSALCLSTVCAAGFFAQNVMAFEAMYPADVLIRDRQRLKTAVEGILWLGLMPNLPQATRRQLARLKLRFPLPEPGDDPINFHAGVDGEGRPVVILPVLSLKMVEDTTTAFAWLYERKFSLGKIDLYYTMLRYRPKELFPGGRYLPILKALKAPENVLSDRGVDRLSLSLRNEAIAFLLAHELGHLVLRHKGYDEVTRAHARRDEVAADAFAFRLMARAGSTPIGALIYLQSQAYRLPHRAEYPTVDAWRAYLETSSTHPLTVERLDAIAEFIRTKLVRDLASSRATWRYVATRISGIAEILRDGDLHACLAKIAAKAPFDVLKPSRDWGSAAAMTYCKSLPQP